MRHAVLWTRLITSSCTPPCWPPTLAGLTLLGGSAGLVTSSALAAFDVSPSYGDSLYQVWAAATGASLGVGAGFLLDARGATGTVPAGATIAGLGATLALAGAVSTAAFPDGVPQDLGDLALKPLLVGFSLYHVTALLGAANADTSLVLGSAFAAPALVSAAITYSAPFIDNTLGDAFLVAATMAWGAWFSSVSTGPSPRARSCRRGCGSASPLAAWTSAL